MKRWDVFISHASEDKETVALPLADALRRAGVRVWLDRFELRVGDSLRERIDEGLADSSFGIVVLSASFLAKGWPRRELNGLFALEESGGGAILPVWHEITKSDLAGYSPMLADRLAADTGDGLSQVAAQLLAAIFHPRGGSPSLADPGLALRLRTLLAGTPAVSEVTAFLAAHPGILRAAAGASPDGSIVWRSDVTAPGDAAGLLPDAAIGELWRSTGRWAWEFVVFGDVGADAADDRGEPSPGIAGALEALGRWRGWVRANRRAAAAWFADIAVDFPCTVVAGRRDEAGGDRKQRLADLNDSLVGTRIRTYDWLTDAAAQLDERRSR